jgi:DNA invertase Pin-like site-specific DNA recombinase
LKKVTKINQIPDNYRKHSKLRVAAYCRVSTDSNDQLQSLDTQIKHYESYIKANPDWDLAGVYYDEGITGTKKEKRPELLQMISDCEDKKIDFIVTKSISRFARNTTDCLELVRKLTGHGIFIYFEKENINTGSMESELMLSILSGLAENESTSISENNKWSIKRRFQNGTYKISSPPYGYDAVDGKLIVNKAQAEIVRFIFTEILSGKGTQKIADELNRRGVPTKRNVIWGSTTIRGMASNEKYTGDAIFQKTYTDSSFNRHINAGEKDQYLFRNHHETIISHEDFESAQAIIEQSGKEKGVKKNHSKYMNRYPFSGKIICGECGGKFKRKILTSGKRKIVWSCSTHISDIDQCSMKSISDFSIEYAFTTMMNKLIFGHKTILKPLFDSLKGVNAKDSMAVIQEIDKKLEENAEQQKVLVSLMTKGYLDPPVYNKGNNELLQENEQLQQQKDSWIRLLNSDDKTAKEVNKLLRFTSKSAMLSEFDSDLFGRFVDHIIVYSRSEIGFHLKCGTTLKERLVK